MCTNTFNQMWQQLTKYNTKNVYTRTISTQRQICYQVWSRIFTSVSCTSCLHVQKHSLYRQWYMKKTFIQAISVFPSKWWLLVYLLWKHFISFVLKVMPQIGLNLPLPYTYRYQWVDLIKQYQICTTDCGIKSLNSFSVQYMLVPFSKFHAFLKTWEKPLALMQDQEMQQQFWPK